MSDADGPSVLAIYREGIASGHATFEDRAPSWETWSKEHLATPRLVAVEGRDILGWAALTAVSSRCIYAGVAEVSVYVAERARGMGVGRRLMEKLIAESERAGIWTLQAGIFPENRLSIALHENCGFRFLGLREKVGRMSYGPLEGRWRDVALLERRSAVIGVD